MKNGTIDRSGIGRIRFTVAGGLRPGSQTNCGGSYSCEPTKEELKATEKLVIYSPNSEGLLNATVPVFEKMYGVDVEVISAGTGECITRLEGEKNNPYADVMYGGNFATFKINAHLFQNYVSPNEANVMDLYKNTLGYATTYVLDGSVILVNKKLIKDLGIEIKGYKDLLNPALKGKIVSANPTASSSAYAHLTNMLNAIGKVTIQAEEAWKYVADLYANTVTIDAPAQYGKAYVMGNMRSAFPTRIPL